jgi:hypothetical protein
LKKVFSFPSCSDNLGIVLDKTSEKFKVGTDKELVDLNSDIFFKMIYQYIEMANEMKRSEDAGVLDHRSVIEKMAPKEAHTIMNKEKANYADKIISEKVESEMSTVCDDIANLNFKDENDHE